jgi:taurine--2-oxoglutarate transaminase
MIVRKPIADWVRDKYFAGGLTYSGHPLACASAVASIEAFPDEGIVENAAAMGEVFRSELARLQEQHPSIGDVRGLGFYWGIELVKSRETREPLVPFNGAGDDAKPVAAVMKRALERGLYLMTHWNVVMCCPPLTITRDELDEALDVLDDALSLADEFCT